MPSIDRAQGTGDPARTFEPFRSDIPGLVSGWISGDPYECQGVEPGAVAWQPATTEELGNVPEAETVAMLHAYATLPVLDGPLVSSPFDRLWRPLDPADDPFRYACGSDLPFTTTDLLTASSPSDVSASLASAVEETGPLISDRDVDWYVVKQTDDRVLALAPRGRAADDQFLDRTDEGWQFEIGGSTCTPRAWFGERGVGRWRLDPGFPAPGPKTRRLHILGYLSCLGTEKAGKARIHMTNDFALIAIPMRSTVGPHFGKCLGPTKMTVRLPKPLGRRTLYDAGSLPIRVANEKLRIDRINSSGSGG